MFKPVANKFASLQNLIDSNQIIQVLFPSPQFDRSHMYVVIVFLYYLKTRQVF